MKSEHLSRIQMDHYAISRTNLTHQGEHRGRSKIEVKDPRWRMTAILEIHTEVYLGASQRLMDRFAPYLVCI